MSAPQTAEGSSALEVVPAQEELQELKRPRLYRVLLHNDDYTTREFVVEILEQVFHRNENEATRIMLHVHHNGIGVAGVYSREVAETKIALSQQLAHRHEFPLQLSMEPEEEDD